MDATLKPTVDVAAAEPDVTITVTEEATQEYVKLLQKESELLQTIGIEAIESITVDEVAEAPHYVLGQGNGKTIKLWLTLQDGVKLPAVYLSLKQYKELIAKVREQGAGVPVTKEKFYKQHFLDLYRAAYKALLSGKT